MLKFRVTALLQATGGLFVAFGVIREAFGNGVAQRVVDAHAQNTAVTEVIAQVEEFLLHLGGKMTLLPTEHALTGADHRLDAAIVVAGFLMLAAAAVTHVVQRLRGK